MKWINMLVWFQLIPRKVLILKQSQSTLCRFESNGLFGKRNATHENPCTPPERVNDSETKTIRFAPNGFLVWVCVSFRLNMSTFANEMTRITVLSVRRTRTVALATAPGHNQKSPFTVAHLSTLAGFDYCFGVIVVKGPLRILCSVIPLRFSSMPIECIESFD